MHLEILAASPDPPVIAAIVTAAVALLAALISAIFSGVTLYLAGRRETRKWLRESQLEALVDFLDSSFARRLSRVYEVRSRGEQPVGLTTYRSDADQAHKRQNDALTRLRLLAPDEVVVAAEDLHKADEACVSAVFDGATVPTSDEWAGLTSDIKAAREAMIRLARKSLKLKAGAAIGTSRPIRDAHGAPPNGPAGP